MNDEEQHELIEALAKSLIDWHGRIEAIAEPLSDKDVEELAEVCRKQALPDESRNFSSPEWAILGTQLERVVTMRAIFRDAAEHMSRTGEAYYCLHCRGTCTPEHLKESEDDDVE